jgi:hypothetical protein
VPDKFDRFLQDVADGVKRVVIAVGARKNHYSKFHALIAPWGILGKSILPQWRQEFSEGNDAQATKRILNRRRNS